MLERSCECRHRSRPLLELVAQLHPELAVRHRETGVERDRFLEQRGYFSEIPFDVAGADGLGVLLQRRERWCGNSIERLVGAIDRAAGAR